MAVSEQNESRVSDVFKALDESNLPGALKEDLRGIVRSTADATNGMDAAEKQQAISQGLFDLARITIYNMIHEAREQPRTWKDVVVETRMQLCFIAVVAAVVLILRPEIAKILESLAQ